METIRSNGCATDAIIEKKKKKKKFAKVLNRRKNLHIQMRYTQIYISTYREAEKDDSILETVFYAQRHSRGA